MSSRLVSSLVSDVRERERVSLIAIGIVYLITFWYPPDKRSLRIAFVLASATLAGAFGGCIAYGVGFLNNAGGLEGFRWLFIIEGALTILSVGLVVRFLPDWPSSASWLSEDEKLCVSAQVQAASGGGFTREHASRREILETCFSPRMVAHYTSYVNRPQTMPLETTSDMCS